MTVTYRETSHSVEGRRPQRLRDRWADRRRRRCCHPPTAGCRARRSRLFRPTPPHPHGRTAVCVGSSMIPNAGPEAVSATSKAGLRPTIAFVHPPAAIRTTPLDPMGDAAIVPIAALDERVPALAIARVTGPASASGRVSLTRGSPAPLGAGSVPEAGDRVRDHTGLTAHDRVATLRTFGLSCAERDDLVFWPIRLVLRGSAGRSFSRRWLRPGWTRRSLRGTGSARRG